MTDNNYGDNQSTCVHMRELKMWGKKCHLWKLDELPVQEVALHNNTSCSLSIGHWKPEPSGSVPVQVVAELVQKVPPVVEVWHFPTQICSCDSMWKLEGGQVWSPILEER